LDKQETKNMKDEQPRQADAYADMQDFLADIDQLEQQAAGLAVLRDEQTEQTDLTDEDLGPHRGTLQSWCKLDAYGSDQVDCYAPEELGAPRSDTDSALHTVASPDGCPRKPAEALAGKGQMRSDVAR
jgi:hypothetical protein